MKLRPGELLAAINRQTGGEADPELAAAVAEDAGRIVDWLAAQGAAFTQASPIDWHRFTLAPPRGVPGRIGRGVGRTAWSPGCGAARKAAGPDVSWDARGLLRVEAAG